MNLLNFNSNNKSWKMYSNTITSIANDDLLIKPNNGNNLILEVSANNNIFLKRGDISYSINTKFTSIDTSFNDVYSKFTTIDTSFIQVNTKFFIIDASFNNKLASISGNIVPFNDICYNLGNANKRWTNAYIRDISVTNISASGNIVPLFNLNGSLGSDTKQWNIAYINNLSGLVNINGQPYVSGSGTGTINPENVTTNINPSIDNNGSLGYFNFRSYTLDTTPLSWSDHKIRAETVPNRYLAAILNAEDNVKATALITANTWIGGRRRSGITNATDKTSLSWYWDTGEPWNYHNWDSTQPNSTTEMAVRIHPGGLWHDHNPTSLNTGPALYMTYLFTTKRWRNAYIRDLSVSSIGEIENLNPLTDNTGSLGIANDYWGNAYIRDLSIGTIDVSVNLNPSNLVTSSLGIANDYWGNAYIRDLSLTNISISGNLNPLFTSPGSLGTSNKIWNIAYIKDLSGLVNVNGESVSRTINLENVTTNINPLINNSESLGFASKRWSNAYIRDLSVGSIDISENCNPLIFYGRGGTVIRQNEYIYNIFTTPGQSTFVPSMNGTVEVLLVGGGGGGGQILGSGGGGGGVIWIPSVTVSGGMNYNIEVGAGGSSGIRGNNTSAFGAIAAGGGNGISHIIPSGSGYGISGGSGGGAIIVEFQNAIRYTGGGGKVGNFLPQSINGTSYGEKGGDIISDRVIGGPLRQAGGGGASAPGFNTDTTFTGTTTQTTHSSGGQGILNTIYFGLNYYWGGGGGGAAFSDGIISQGGWGGLGGGGGGSSTNVVGTIGGIGGGSALNSGSDGIMNSGSGGAGGANTGGGGGGGAWPTGLGGAGGSGIVIIRYLSPQSFARLGLPTKRWNNAFIRNLTMSSIDVTNNLNPLYDLSGSLGEQLKRWRNANIRDLSASATTTSFFRLTHPIYGGSITTDFRIGTGPISKVGIVIPSIFDSVDSFGLRVINRINTANNWSAINIEAKAILYWPYSLNKAGIQFTVGNSSTGVYGNTWNIHCRDNDGSLIFYKNNTFHTQTGGGATSYITSNGTYTINSDDRLKHNEIIINNGLAIIRQLVPKFYQKTQVMLDAKYNGDLNDYDWCYEAGLIAQEVLQINDISFAVSGGDTYDSSNNVIPGVYLLGYNHIFIYGLAAIKELHKKVKAQESNILSLQTNILNQETTILNQQTLINSLIARIEALENKV